MFFCSINKIVVNYAHSFTINQRVKDKYELLEGFDFPNVPYYQVCQRNMRLFCSVPYTNGLPMQDDKVKLTQYKAILEYLGRRHGLWPATEELVTEQAVLREVASDLSDRVVEYVYSGQHRSEGVEMTAEEKREKRRAFLARMPTQLRDLSRRHEKKGGKWMLGDKLSYVDFMMYEFLVRPVGANASTEMTKEMFLNP